MGDGWAQGLCRNPEAPPHLCGSLQTPILRTHTFVKACRPPPHLRERLQRVLHALDPQHTQAERGEGLTRDRLVATAATAHAALEAALKQVLHEGALALQQAQQKGRSRHHATY